MKKEGGGDEIELSLELSIGGNYGKSENSRYDDDKVQCPNPVAVRSNFSDNGCEYPQRRREIQAFRRQEARKRRVEKLKRSRTVEDGAVEVLLRDPPCKKKGVCSDGFAKESSPSSATEIQITRQKMEQDCSYRNAQCVLSGNGLTHPFWVPNIGESKKSQANIGIPLRDCDSIQNGSSPVKDHGYWKTESNRSLERSASVVSDYQSTSTKGGSSSGTGSHVASRSTQEEQFDGNTSSPTELRTKQLPDDCTKLLDPSVVPQKSKASYCLNQTNDICSPSSVSPPSSQHRTDGESEKPIRPPVRGLSTTPLPHMPCVSATGNGPNGKTITGFLYKYTKTEVSIICVCHGNSFSPAEFVEHAGGVDISHPLRHITIVPSSF